MDLYLKENKVEDDMKVPEFLNAVGRKNYSLLRHLLAPEVLAEQSLETLTSTLKKHFESKSRDSREIPFPQARASSWRVNC